MFDQNDTFSVQEALSQATASRSKYGRADNDGICLVKIHYAGEMSWAGIPTYTVVSKTRTYIDIEGLSHDAEITSKKSAKKNNKPVAKPWSTE